MSEKNEEFRPEESAELHTEQMDHLPQGDEYTEDPFAGKTGVEIRYNLKPDEVKKGLLILQKEQIFRRNYIYTAVLGVLFVLYVITLIKKPDYGMGYAMLALCAGVIALIWLMAWRYRSSQAKAVSMVEEDFNMTVFDSGILVHQENGDFHALFSEPKFVVRELEDCFLLDLNRQRIYLLPKRCIPEADQETIRGYFAGNMKEE